MPWCEECAKYFTPNSVKTDGSCPTCGDTIQLAEGHDHGDAETVANDESSPWHFKLMVFTVVAYLGWRVVDLVI